MNKRIKGLIDQCTYLNTTYINGIDESTEEFDKEMFAALIIKECMMICGAIQGAGEFKGMPDFASGAAKMQNNH